jgi:hypothetical protein
MPTCCYCGEGVDESDIPGHDCQPKRELEQTLAGGDD